MEVEKWKEDSRVSQSAHLLPLQQLGRQRKQGAGGSEQDGVVRDRMHSGHLRRLRNRSHQPAGHRRVPVTSATVPP